MAFSASATIVSAIRRKVRRNMYTKCIFWGPTRVIQYENEPVMNRLSMLPENQLTDILMSLDRILRPTNSRY